MQAFQGNTQQHGTISQMHHAKWEEKKKPDLKGYTLCNSINVTFWKRQNDRDGNKITKVTKHYPKGDN